MSARSPFRSHLLQQQWNQNRRSPFLQQWIQQQHQQAQLEEEDHGLSTVAAPSRNHRQSNTVLLSDHGLKHYRNRLPPSGSLSSVDSLSLGLSVLSSRPSTSRNNILHSRSTGSDEASEETLNLETILDSHDPPRQGSTFGETKPQLKIYHRNDFLLPSKIKSYPEAIRDMMAPREVGSTMDQASHLFSTKDDLRASDSNDTRLDRTQSRNDLRFSIDRATEKALPEGRPSFRFRRFPSSSKKGQALIDMRFQLTSKENQSLAVSERIEWEKIAAFLVTLVHDNQCCNRRDDDDLLALLDYSPPHTQEQLETYGRACAATQDLVRTLQNDGYHATFSTNNIIRTTAFRSLVKARDTDRIASLVLVHGPENSTDFASLQE